MSMPVEVESTPTTQKLHRVEVPIVIGADDVPQVPKVRVRPATIVVFLAGDETVSISFPKPGVFPTTEIATMQTENIEVWIPSSARRGPYEYVIFVHGVGKHGKYAECNSHPVMIVESPRKP